MSLLALVAFSAFAQEKEEPKFPAVKLSGVIYPSYSLDLTGTGTAAGPSLYNSFDIDRVYLRTDVAMNKQFGLRVTLDADHMKPAVLATGEEVELDTKYRVFVKHAYLEVKDLGPIKLRAGMVATPYIGFYDDFWNNRYITKSFTESAGGLASADLGLNVAGKHAGGLVDWSVALVNGEGYSKLETDPGKQVQGRLTVDPLAKMENRKLPISGFAAYTGHDGADPTFHWGGAAAFEMPRLFVWAEVLGQSEGNVSGLGYSATLNPRLPKYAGLIARYDHWDPDTNAQDDGENTLIAGIDKDFLEKVSVAITYERSWIDGAMDAAEHGIVVHTQAGF